MNPRTVRDFTAVADVWPIVDAWAQQSSYRLMTTSQSSRVYQRGQGILTAPMMLALTQTGNQVHLEAWIRVSLFVRLFALFLIPAEMGIESGGFRAVLPRKIARGAVNKLLTQLGQPPIG